MLRVTREEEGAGIRETTFLSLRTMYQATQGDEQDISVLKFKHTALLAFPFPTFLCMPILLDNGRDDGTPVWIPAAWHRVPAPNSLACCRCQVLSQCHPAADLCVFGQAVQRTNTLHTPLGLYPDTISPKIRVIQGSAVFGQVKIFSTKNLAGNNGFC